MFLDAHILAQPTTHCPPTLPRPHPPPQIMKSDEDVRMISAEAPVLFAKACELFILELTLKAWMHADANKRRTLQRSDIADVVHGTYILDFLVRGSKGGRGRKGGEGKGVKGTKGVQRSDIPAIVHGTYTLRFLMGGPWVGRRGLGLRVRKEKEGIAAQQRCRGCCGRDSSTAGGDQQVACVGYGSTVFMYPLACSAPSTTSEAPSCLPPRSPLHPPDRHHTLAARHHPKRS